MIVKDDAVERAADAIARARGYVRGACLDEHYRDARAALAAAGAGAEVDREAARVESERRYGYPESSPRARAEGESFQAGAAWVLAARGDAATLTTPVRCGWCERPASGTAEHSDGLRHPACPEHGLPGAYQGDAATPTVTAEKMLDAWAEAVADGVRGTTPWRFLAALGVEVEGGEQRA